MFYNISLAALLFCLSGNVSAERPQWSGQYVFSGSVIALQTVHEPVIWAGSEKGRDEIATLREKGYACERKPNQWVRCRKFLQPEVPEPIAAYVIHTYGAQAKIEFGEQRGDDQIVFEGERYRQWQVNQSLKFGDRQYPEFRWIDLADLSKVEMGDFSQGSGESVVVAGKGFHWMRTVRKQDFTYTVMMEINPL